MKIFNTLVLGLAQANQRSKDFCMNTIELPCAENENCPRWKCPEGTGHGKTCEQFCSITNAEAVGIRTCVCYRQSGPIRLFIGCRWVEKIDETCPTVAPPEPEPKPLSNIIRRRPVYSASVVRKSSAPTRDVATNNVSIFRAMGVQKPTLHPPTTSTTTVTPENNQRETKYPSMASLGIKLEDFKVNLKSAAGSNNKKTFGNRSEAYSNCPSIDEDSICENDGFTLRCHVNCRNRNKVNKCVCVNGNCKWSSTCGILNGRSRISPDKETVDSIRTIKIQDGTFINLRDFIDYISTWVEK